MRHRRSLIGFAIATAVLSITYASAAGLSVTANSLGADGSSVVPCDADGVDVVYTLTGDTVTQMAVQGIAAGCNGGELSAVLLNASGTSIGQGGPQVVAGSTATLNLSPQPTSFDVEDVHVVIVGP